MSLEQCFSTSKFECVKIGIKALAYYFCLQIASNKLKLIYFGKVPTQMLVAH